MRDYRLRHTNTQRVEGEIQINYAETLHDEQHEPREGDLENQLWGDYCGYKPGGEGH